MGGAYEGLSVTAMMTKECEQVLGKKAQGVEAPSALSILKGKVCGHVCNTPGHVTAHVTAQVTPQASKYSPRGQGFTASGGANLNQQRSTMNADPRRNKGGGASANLNLSRTSRSVTMKRNVKSPSPPPASESDQQEEIQQGSNGLVISNRNEMGDFMEDDEAEDLSMLDEHDGEMEGLKKEEEDTLSILIDSRLLHKDFIVDKFSLALVSFRKVSNQCIPEFPCRAKQLSKALKCAVTPRLPLSHPSLCF